MPWCWRPRRSAQRRDQHPADRRGDGVRDGAVPRAAARGRSRGAGRVGPPARGRWRLRLLPRPRAARGGALRQRGAVRQRRRPRDRPRLGPGLLLGVSRRGAPRRECPGAATGFADGKRNLHALARAGRPRPPLPALPRPARGAPAEAAARADSGAGEREDRPGVPRRTDRAAGAKPAATRRRATSGSPPASRRAPPSQRSPASRTARRRRAPRRCRRSQALVLQLQLPGRSATQPRAAGHAGPSPRPSWCCGRSGMLIFSIRPAGPGQRPQADPGRPASQGQRRREQAPGQRQGGGRFPEGGHRVRVTILDRQTLRPEQLAEVACIREQGARVTQAPVGLVHQIDCPFALLCDESEDRSPDRKGQQREFLGHQPHGNEAAAARDPPPPSERPPVEEQEQGRKGHQHWLCHQPEGEKEGRSEIPRDSGMACVAHPRPEREQAEERREDVLALGDPDDGFTRSGWAATPPRGGAPRPPSRRVRRRSCVHRATGVPRSTPRERSP